ncbi:restriction endonuclease [Bacillus aerolatus]|uniref:Restriction endonuclease n=1 Tax=Bacillus aerolatus TaxID=2653354 RepID=A0A6I1FJM4_9BACI|nr:restriction endonuclease [Bacillus aerolatus]KAB7708790.1 restriction endonuclease [Bacillus aerolatus]
MNRGYAGFYKNFYLRSSYEYAYAVYLDYFSLPWSYEDKVFDIGYKKYKPDFFFYDKYGNLEKIVEIKSREPKVKENALKILNTIEEIYNIKCVLISYEELLELYNELPFSLNSVITKWNSSLDTTINKSSKGELNAHYQMKHSEEVKKKIGEHTKQLWASNSASKERMIEGLRKSGLSQKGKIKTPREIRRCKLCIEKFEVLITSSQVYCSQQCSGKYAIEIATQAYIHKREGIHAEIRTYIIQWAEQNKELILQAQFNRIKPTINPMVEEIYQRFGVKDFRVISKAVFGEDRGRKELLIFMKQVCNEDVC